MAPKVGWEGAAGTDAKELAAAPEPPAALKESATALGAPLYIGLGFGTAFVVTLALATRGWTVLGLGFATALRFFAGGGGGVSSSGPSACAVLRLSALELLTDFFAGGPFTKQAWTTPYHRSQTGYKMRKHITKALQARSKAVHNTIDRYNTAASALVPPMPQMSWEQVVEYVFLANFDILRDTGVEIQSRPWTRPAYRLAMDQYFKILLAKEEIQRLNIEIPAKESELRDTAGKSKAQVDLNIQMAVQVCLYWQRRGRFDNGHMRKVWALAKTPGFTGSIMLGVSLEQRDAQHAARAACEIARASERAAKMDVDEVVVVDAAAGSTWPQNDDTNDEWEDTDENKEEWKRQEESVRELGDDGEEDMGERGQEEAVSGMLYQIFMLAVHGSSTQSEDEV
ncbi:hypothetical protein C8R43DRAFT_1131867 [Mycena crocata]|nr:hypothetical protein C8R43DRAFT_1131867 [Mycena crocata]